MTNALRILFFPLAIISVFAIWLAFGMAVDYETIGYGLHPSIASLLSIILIAGNVSYYLLVKPE